MMRQRLDQRPCLRACLAAVVVGDLTSLYVFLDRVRHDALADNLPLAVFGDIVSRPPVMAGIVLVGVICAALFAGKAGRIGHGLVSLVALVLLNTAHAQLYGSPWRHLYYSGLCLLGWLVGLAVSRRRGLATDESYARMGSIALLAAAYFNAGISKIVFGGTEWLYGVPIQAVILGQDGLVPDSVLSGLRSWVVETPASASLLSVLTLGFELAGPLMIAGRGLRLCVVLGLLAMHLTIYLLTPILYWEAMVLLVLFGVSRDDREETAPGRAPEFLTTRAFILATSLLAICAAVAIGHQTRRYWWTQAEKNLSISRTPVHSAGSQPATVDEVAAPPPRRAGPFVVGQALTETWVVEDLLITDDALVIAIRGDPGRARFELTCRAQHHSPFDLGALHILYSQHVPFAALERAGWVLRQKVEEMVGGGDACERLAAWRKLAQ